MFIRRLFLTCVLATFGSQNIAEPFSGNDILHACEGGEATVQQGFCFGYVFGAVEGLKWGALIGVVSKSSGEIDSEQFDFLSSAALGFCIPPTVENGQVLDIVVRYLVETPEKRHESARTLIQSALASSFPCS
ncbi:Rap1a/Tai family immunity protein [Ruegeria sp. WL0004]|uniref:Rap1a/Tai family immunity protein n=1 Tax=Ruegeria marisflavi TaxID=2984152 RepID=A0ABT2WTY0_9RHOB|nr:Rap1a/Tai family immunity protein [Ruegeria sp. WL0004]MCU9839357.1 Rap1a/Tai family immunity protein [Ruegeria sp. WL0004]